MKKYFTSKTLIALAVAVAAAAAYESLANEQPIPPPASASALPDNIQPSSSVAQIFKLAQAGVDAAVIQNYISNCPTAFNLDADKIIALTDAGVSSEMVNAMFAHDKNYLASINSSPAPATPPAPTPTTTAENNSPPPAAPAAAAPPAEMTINNFYDTLSPYGQWVQVDGYGRCWRPTAVAYDATWQPYCDRGHWVYTDCGWYWNSDYSWGVTFHYGRWFNTPQYGWCWWPDTVWAPSWVTWRSSSDYCGWAPLPPYTAYQPGVGFTYHGGNVSVSFGFGLAANCFTFVSVGNFCEPHPRYYCLPQQQVTQIYNQTTIINNYNCNNRTIVNNGLSVTVIGAAAHHPIQAVGVGTISNAGRHGWRGQGEMHPSHPYGANTSDGAATRPFAGNGSHHDGTTTTSVGGVISGNHSYSTSPTPNPSRGQNQHETGFTRGNLNPSAQPPQNQIGTVNNSAPNRGQSRNNLILTGGENRQTARPYAAPVVSGNWSPAANQHSPLPQPADSRQQTRLANPHLSSSAPSVAVEGPQRREPRQNFGQSASHNNMVSAPSTSIVSAPHGGMVSAPSTPMVTAPRNFTITAPVTPAVSAPMQTQNGSFNGGGRHQNWFAQNR